MRSSLQVCDSSTDTTSTFRETFRGMKIVVKDDAKEYHILQTETINSENTFI